MHLRQGGQSSQSSQSSSPWHNRNLGSESSSPAPETQDVRDEVLDLLNARRGGGGNGREVPDLDGTDVERPSKRRYDFVMDARKVMVLTLHIPVNRKTSPTQPGRGIRKIVDLYHDLSDLLSKANKHSTILNELNPATIEEMDKLDFVGMTDDEIDEEKKEYAQPHL
jgi:hypothetical protein